MSSGDPLVDDLRDRQAAVDNMVNSLLKKGDEIRLALENNKRQSAAKQSAAVPSVVLAANRKAESDPLADAIEEERKAREKLVNDLLNGKGLSAKLHAEDLLTADSKRNIQRPVELLNAATDSRRAEASPLVLAADRSHGAMSGDFTQLLGGALLMVVAVALVAIVSRRRQPKPREEKDECEYQLFM